MADYIEREALLAEYDRQHTGEPGRARKLIEGAPAADVVEVVRCEKCRYSRPLNRNDPFENMFCDGVVWCMDRSDGVMTDDFCSNGARMDGE